GSNCWISQAICVLNWEASNREIFAALLFPWMALFQKVATSFPKGFTVPKPVITTLFISFLFVFFLYKKGELPLCLSFTKMVDSSHLKRQFLIQPKNRSFFIGYKGNLLPSLFRYFHQQ